MKLIVEVEYTVGGAAPNISKEELSAWLAPMLQTFVVNEAGSLVPMGEPPPPENGAKTTLFHLTTKVRWIEDRTL